MKIVSETQTETIPLKKLESPETKPSNTLCQWKNLNDSGLLYIIRKLIERRLRWYHFLKRGLKLLPSETSKMVYGNEDFSDSDNTLYIVENVLKNPFNGNILEKLKLFVQVHK